MITWLDMALADGVGLPPSTQVRGRLVEEVNCGKYNFLCAWLLLVEPSFLTKTYHFLGNGFASMGEDICYFNQPSAQLAVNVCDNVYMHSHYNGQQQHGLWPDREEVGNP